MKYSLFVALLFSGGCGAEVVSAEMGVQGDFAMNPAVTTDFAVDALIGDSAVDANPGGDLSAGAACRTDPLTIIQGTPCQPLGLQCRYHEYQCDCECAGWFCSGGVPFALDNVDCGGP